MAKVRLSTTVNVELLDAARRLHDGHTDSSVIEAALRALLQQYRAAEIDAQYAAAYRRLPPDSADEWGDLVGFLDAASRT